MRVLTVSFLLAVSLLSAGCSDFYNFFGIESDEDKRIREESLMRFYAEQSNVPEPTVDIIEVAAGQSEDRMGVGVKTAGGPAPQTAYSNYVEVRARNGAQEISVVVQRHDGVDSTIVNGVALADVQYVPTPWGHYIEIPRQEGWDQDLTIFEIFMGFLETDSSPFIQDETGDLEGEETEPVEDILSEIDEVFVPA
jgi:hypothetical protein